MYALSAVLGFTLVMPSLVAQSSATTQPIPEEARKHFVMGATFFKDARTADDYAQVESEFKQAAGLAPQWPDARYNLALAREAAGDYAGAIADLKLYLQFKLSDADARTAQDKIYALEAKSEETAKKQADVDEQTAAAQRAQAAQAASDEALIRSLDGAVFVKHNGDAYQRNDLEVHINGGTATMDVHVLWMNAELLREGNGSIGDVHPTPTSPSPIPHVGRTFTATVNGSPLVIEVAPDGQSLTVKRPYEPVLTLVKQ